MKRARTAFYQQIIKDNSSDRWKLFAASNQLLNLNHDLVFPQFTDDKMLANDIATFSHKTFNQIWVLAQ